jgi:hypothetical protein
METVLQWSHERSQIFALFGLKGFLVVVVAICIIHSRTLFFQHHGWSHRLAGAIHLAWLTLGAFTCTSQILISPNLIFLYDVLLGVFGVCATLTAARDFPHKLVTNTKGQSGTLHLKAIVTQAEMLEHSFYQGLNLLQAVYLHISARTNHSQTSVWWRLFMLWLVTLPWAVRNLFPVHSFSHNWKLYKGNEVEVIMYRIKKAQYLFYKHVILHGVNISVAVIMPTNEDFNANTAEQGHLSSTTIPYSIPWRVFWILLNLSYVMEFFLQTLVKRGVLSQPKMLALNRFLMAAASLSALVVFQHVSFGICGVSLLLNLYHRHHDILNTMLVAALASIPWVAT